MRNHPLARLKNHFSRMTPFLRRDRWPEHRKIWAIKRASDSSLSATPLAISSDFRQPDRAPTYGNGGTTHMISALTKALSTRYRHHNRIFIAWSHETEPAAEAIRAYLDHRGFSTWMSAEIKGGRRFREEIGSRIRTADLVIAVLPTNPSHWIVAEAGLAYFEQKLIPISLGSDSATDLFEDLQTLKISHIDDDEQLRSELANIVQAIEDRLGFSETGSVFLYIARLLNLLFFVGIPLLGITLVASFLWHSLHAFYLSHSVPGFDADPSNIRAIEFSRAGHIVLGSIVYGGAVFVALLFSRAGISNSFVERQFCISTARKLFFVWFWAMVLELLGGLYLLKLLYVSHRVNSYTKGWVFGSLIAYFVASVCFFWGFIYYRESSNADIEGRERRVVEMQAFVGNLAFGLGLVALTVVIVLMGLKDQVQFIWT
jgi:hypothetical protein